MNIKNEIKWRVYTSFIVICIMGICIIAKAATLQIAHGKELKAKGRIINTKNVPVEAERGNIYSADGSLLSVSMPVFDIYLDVTAPKPDSFKRNVKALSKELANLLQNKTAAGYESYLNEAFQNKCKYLPIVKKLSYDKYIKLREFPLLKLGQNRGGLIVEKNIKRINPYNLLANRTIGLFRNNKADVGLEAKYDATLRGSDGYRLLQKVPGSVWLPVDGSEIDPINGKDIVTTIDVNIQDIAEQSLLNVLTKEDAIYGTCIVMETKTGAIKAMANLGKDKVKGGYWEDLNYALRPIEPGSTFKINALLSAIDDGYVTLDTKVNANGGTHYFAGQKMSDSHLGTGSVSVKDAFAHSSNVACAKLIYNNYLDHPNDYIKHLQKMHIMDPTGIDLAGEQKPYITATNSHFQNKASLAWLAIGYEVMITPLRTAMVYNTIANDGVMMKPYLVKEVREYGNLVQYNTPTVIERNVCKPSTIKALKEAAFEVVQSGTGKALKNDVFTICGKTGTAQVADKGITYADKVYNGSFVGFFPKDNPMYTICVVIRTKKGASNYYGGQIALPVFKEVANRLYANNVKEQPSFGKKDTSIAKKLNTANGSVYKLKSIQNILSCFNTIPNGQWVTSEIDSTGKENLVARTISKTHVPSVRNMGLQDATQLLELSGLQVLAVGKGRVTSQSIPAGTTFKKGQIIKLTLE